MSLYVFAASTFIPPAATPVQAAVGGGVINVGDAVYRETTGPSAGQYFQSVANSTTPVTGGAVSPETVNGVCAAPCAGAGCPMAVVTGIGSVVNTGATTTTVMAAGDVLVLSTTAGQLQKAPAASGSRAIIVAVANSATQYQLVLAAGGVCP